MDFKKGNCPVSSFRKKYLTNIWNVPNILTIVRMLLIPVFVAFYVAGLDKLSLLTFLVASATDWLDGYLARKHNQITDFGKLMDPLADKLMVCTALICQGITGIFPWWAIVVVLIKELVMIAGSTYMLNHNIVVYANMMGKSAQVSFIAALILSFWHADFIAIRLPLDRIFLIIAVILALAALVDYTTKALKQIHSIRK